MKFPKEDVDQIIVILRYGSRGAKDFTRRILSLKAIGAQVGKSAFYVRQVCLAHEERARKLYGPMRDTTRKKAKERAMKA